MKTIMIIDDDVELVENVKIVLEDPEVTLVTRDTTEGAIEQLVEVHPDLLILVIQVAGHSDNFSIRVKKNVLRCEVLVCTVNFYIAFQFSV